MPCLELVNNPDQNAGFMAAFVAPRVHHKVKVHLTDLPPLSQYWKEMEHHSHAKEFKATAAKEYGDLAARGTFIPMDTQNLAITTSSRSNEYSPTKWIPTAIF